MAQSPSLPSILHLVHPFGGGTMEYVKHLQLLFPSFQHTVVHTLEAADAFFRDPMDEDRPVKRCRLFHIHAMVNEAPCEALAKLVHWIRHTLDVPIAITVHDYQWLFGLGDPSPSKEQFDQRAPDPENPYQRASQRLFHLVDTVLYPSVAVFDNYQRYLPHPNAVLAPHNDTATYPTRLCIPPIQNQTINIAYVGHFQELKGAHLFTTLANAVRGVRGLDGIQNTAFRYHVIGGNVPSNAPAYASILTFHGAYQEHELQHILDRLGIHVILMLSQAQETYSYVLTKVINSGRAIVYIPRGSLLTRLNPTQYPRFIPVQNKPESVAEGLVRAVQWVHTHAGQQDPLPEDIHTIRKTPWYEKHYPPGRPGLRGSSRILL